MRKMLIAFTILAMASMASADVPGMYLTIGGVQAPDKIELEPSDWIELDLEVGIGDKLGGFDVEIQLSNPQGHLEFTSMVIPVTLTPPPYMFWQGAPTVVTSDPQNLRVTGGWMTPLYGQDFVNPIIILNGLMFHCDEITDVIVDLVVPDGGSLLLNDVSYEAGTLIDTLLIKQPEPMTILMLGLGGLLLRRRK